MVKSLHDFKSADEEIKALRVKQHLNEKKKEEVAVNEKFSEYLVDFDKSVQKRLDDAKSIAKFWDKQCQVKKEIRQKERQVDAEFQDATKRHEGNVIFIFCSKMPKSIYPLKKSRFCCPGFFVPISNFRILFIIPH